MTGTVCAVGITPEEVSCWEALRDFSISVSSEPAGPHFHFFSIQFNSFIYLCQCASEEVGAEERRNSAHLFLSLFLIARNSWLGHWIRLRCHRQTALSYSLDHFSYLERLMGICHSYSAMFPQSHQSTLSLFPSPF